MQRAKINVLFVTFASNRISRLHPPMWKEDRVSASHRLVDSHHKCISNKSCIIIKKKSKAISFGLQSLFSSIPELARICAEKKKKNHWPTEFFTIFKNFPVNIYYSNFLKICKMEFCFFYVSFALIAPYGFRLISEPFFNPFPCQS